MRRWLDPSHTHRLANLVVDHQYFPSIHLCKGIEQVSIWRHMVRATTIKDPLIQRANPLSRHQYTLKVISTRSNRIRGLHRSRILSHF